MLYGHEMGGDKTLLELLKESEKYKEKSGTEFDKLEKIFENYKENPVLEKVIKGNSSIYDAEKRQNSNLQIGDKPLLAS
ncbi:hypothetical protein COT07_01560 [Candidatus Woesearchaeota archaeon CG07_land_8_20_14_0_80_44_23]|nr:MAG: hypothetical protein COT07_01560 [Candidatus Woesearchaeota archaeon CG07_land_8_20_14_0_80_44_23]